MSDFDGSEEELDGFGGQDEFDEEPEGFEDEPEGDEGDPEGGEGEPEGDEVEQPVRRQGNPGFNSLAAEHRILQRNYGVLERRFTQVIDLLRQQQQGGGAADVEEEEELPDPDENLGGHLVGKISKIERRLEKGEQERRQREQDEQVVRQFNAAQETIQTYRSENPDLYDAAVEHLVFASIEELMDFAPDLTQEEAEKAVARETAKWVLNWHKRGLNPGEQVMRMALRRGFQVPRGAGGKQKPGPGMNSTEQRRQRDPREEVNGLKDRERRSRTISSVSGAPARRNGKDPKRLLQLSEDEWEKEMTGMKVTDILKATTSSRRK